MYMEGSGRALILDTTPAGGTEEGHANMSGSLSPVRDLNPGFPGYEAGRDVRFFICSDFSNFSPKHFRFCEYLNSKDGI